MFVVVDGQESPRYDALVPDSVRFSPDSQRLAYGVRQGEQWSVVLDGKPGQLYDGIGAGSLVFSPNGQRLAYVAQVGKQQVVGGRRPGRQTLPGDCGWQSGVQR